MITLMIIFMITTMVVLIIIIIMIIVLVRWVLKQHFVGHPKPEDFDLVAEELPPLQDRQFRFWQNRFYAIFFCCCKKYIFYNYRFHSLFLSVDPYMRPYTSR